MLKCHRVKWFRCKTKRFISAVDTKMAAITYTITPVNFSGSVTFVPYIDGDVKNKDSNYDEKFWDEVKEIANRRHFDVTGENQKARFSRMFCHES